MRFFIQKDTKITCWEFLEKKWYFKTFRGASRFVFFVSFYILGSFKNGWPKHHYLVVKTYVPQVDSFCFWSFLLNAFGIDESKKKITAMILNAIPRACARTSWLANLIWGGVSRPCSTWVWHTYNGIVTILHIYSYH